MLNGLLIQATVVPLAVATAAAAVATVVAPVIPTEEVAIGMYWTFLVQTWNSITLLNNTNTLQRRPRWQWRWLLQRPWWLQRLQQRRLRWG